MDSNVKSGAIDLSEMLNDISVPALVVPELDILPSKAKSDDLFASKSRKAWHEANNAEARCYFAPNKVSISFLNPSFAIISLWKRSLYGRTLTEIKADDSMIERFASGVANLIGQVLGHSLASGDWCIVTSPKRRHKTHNFATLIAAQIGEILHIPFYEDVAQCHSKHRVGAVFSFGAQPPTESNIIVFDDFVTTGATMISMKNLLEPLGKNLVFFTGINNKL
jgi:hypothetical protein